MVLLSHDEILKLHRAVVSAELVESRSALLAGIDVSFVAGLASASTPSDQILLDLGTLNQTSRLEDGSLPLAIWLMNALARAGKRAEASMFREALAKCGGHLPPDLGDSRRPPPRRRGWMIAITVAAVGLPAAIVLAAVLIHGHAPHEDPLVPARVAPTSDASPTQPAQAADASADAPLDADRDAPAPKPNLSPLKVCGFCRNLGGYPASDGYKKSEGTKTSDPQRCPSDCSSCISYLCSN